MGKMSWQARMPAPLLVVMLVGVAGIAGAKVVTMRTVFSGVSLGRAARMDTVVVSQATNAAKPDRVSFILTATSAAAVADSQYCWKVQVRRNGAWAEIGKDSLFARPIAIASAQTGNVLTTNWCADTVRTVWWNPMLTNVTGGTLTVIVERD